MKNLFLVSAFCLFIIQQTSFAQINESKIYWVGHSLVDGKNWSDPNARNLIELMEIFSAASGKRHSSYRHTIPGAPIGWNWGVSGSWHDVQNKIRPLTDPAHDDYGTFDVMVVTEGVNIESSYDAWASGFYARKFYAAAKAANPDTRLFLYESWHHLQATDFRDFYGPAETFDWRDYMLRARLVWEKIADEAADPAVLNAAPDPHNNRGSYVYMGSGPDPGNSNEILDIKIIPTGQVLVKVFDRLAENRSEDNWSYANAVHNGRLSELDFFENPYLNFPEDRSTTVHGGPVDDIHASPVLIYLNALTHYAVIYGEDPKDLPLTDYVPQNIAAIFKEVVWDYVTQDPRTGVNEVVTSLAGTNEANVAVWPNPAKDLIWIEEDIEGELYKIYSLDGALIKEGSSNIRTIDVSEIPSGTYILELQISSGKIKKRLIIE